MWKILLSVASVAVLGLLSSLLTGGTLHRHTKTRTALLLGGLILIIVISAFIQRSITQDVPEKNDNPAVTGKVLHDTMAFVRIDTIIRHSTGPRLGPKPRDIVVHEREVPEHDRLFKVDDYINDTGAQFDIAILVIDDNNRQVSSISSGIAKIYRDNRQSVTTSLFNELFLTSPYLNEIRNANVGIIDKLGLSSHVKYVIIGRYTNTFDNGELTRYISRANLDVVVVSCISRTQTNAFSIPVANGFDDKGHAEHGAIEKILMSYKENYLNL